MSMYAPLADLLAGQEGSKWTVEFGELERLIGVSLPSSAFKYPAWWSNNPSNNSMTKIWLKAGWRTERVDIPNRTVTFRRLEEGDIAKLFGARTPYYGAPWRPAYETKAMSSSFGAPEEPRGDPFRLEDVYQRMKGSIRIAPGADLTEPLSGEWAVNAERWDKRFGDRGASGARNSTKRGRE